MKFAIQINSAPPIVFDTLDGKLVNTLTLKVSAKSIIKLSVAETGLGPINPKGRRVGNDLHLYLDTLPADKTSLILENYYLETGSELVGNTADGQLHTYFAGQDRLAYGVDRLSSLDTLFLSSQSPAAPFSNGVVATLSSANSGWLSIAAIPLLITAAGGGGSNSAPTVNPPSDTTPPSAPLLNLSNGSTITGTAEAGSTITIRDEAGTIIASGLVSAGGTFRFTLSSPLANGTLLTAITTDAAGNASQPAQGITDSAAPALTVSVLDDDGDGLPTLSGVGAEPNSTVTITLPNGSTVTTTANAAGQYSVELLTAPSPLLGTYTASNTDAAGNTGTASTLETDLTAPVAAITSPVRVFDATPVIQGTSDAEDGTTVSVTVAGVTWQTTVNAGVWRVDTESTPASGGPFAALEVGVPVAVSVVSTDAAGNTSAPATQTLGYVMPPDFPLGTVQIALIPEASGNGINALEANDGSWAWIDITNAGVVAGNAVRVYWGSANAVNSDDHSTDSRFVDIALTADMIANNLVRVDIPQALLALTAPAGLRNATVNVQCQLLDQVGGNGGQWSSTALTVIVDRELPGAITAAPSAQATDGISIAEASNGTPLSIDLSALTGAAAPVMGETVRLSLTNASNLTVVYDYALTALDSLSSLTVTIQASVLTQLGTGLVQVSSAWIDLAGNVGPSTAMSGLIALDLAAPGATSLAPSDTQIDSSEFANGITLDATWAAGTAVGDTWTLQFKHPSSGLLLDTITGTVTAANSQTIVISSADIAQLQNAGAVNLVLSVADAAGNPSSAVANSAISFTDSIDTTAPSAPSLTLYSAYHDSTPVLTGTWSPLEHADLSVTLVDADNQSRTYTLSANPALFSFNGNQWFLQIPQDGAWSAPINTTANDYTVTAVGIDLAGNPSSAATTTTGFLAYEKPAASFAGETGIAFTTTSSSVIIGQSMSAAGDIDGDGYADLLVSLNNSARPDQSAVALIFGGTAAHIATASPIDLETDSTVVRIKGDSTIGISGGPSFTGAIGDVNGDGHADFLIANYQGGGTSASQYGAVVFGSATRPTADIQLQNLLNAGNGQGFVVSSDAIGKFGSSAGALGDVNGDGYDDFYIQGIGDSSCTVVFGRASDASFNVDTASTGILSIGNAAGSTTYSNIQLTSAGDINGDGIKDILVTANATDPSRPDTKAWYVFGQDVNSTAWNSPISLDNISGSTGVQINGIDSGITSVSVGTNGADVNADGVTDFVLNPSGVNVDADYDDGRIFIQYGSNLAVSGVTDLSSWRDGNTPDNGLLILNTTDNIANGYTNNIATLGGDYNGDGVNDILVGNSSVGNGQGRIWVVFGSSNADTNTPRNTVLLDDVERGVGGFFIASGYADGMGNSWANVTATFGDAGDVDGDGMSDIVYSGINYPDPNNPQTFGIGHVLLSSESFAQQQSWIATAPGDHTSLNQSIAAFTSGADTITGQRDSQGLSINELILGGAGNDIISGNGGLDRLYGGQGDDTFILGAADLAALYTRVPPIANASPIINGGTGLDTLALSSTSHNMILDLTHGQSTQSRGLGGLTGIEIFDIRGDGNNRIALSASTLLEQGSVLGGTSVHAFDAYFAGDAGYVNLSSNRHQFMVRGDAGDQLHTSTEDCRSIDLATDRWEFVGSATASDGQTYRVFNSLVSRDVTQGENRALSNVQLLVSEAMFTPLPTPMGGYDVANIRNGSQGFTLTGLDYSSSATNVGGIGDVNGDGLADISSFGNNGDRLYIGLGIAPLPSTAMASLNGNALGSGGYVVQGNNSFWSNGGLSGQGLGDVNRDGLGDFVIGHNDWYTYPTVAASIVNGSSNASNVTLTESQNTSNGYSLLRLTGYDYAGTLVNSPYRLNSVFVGAAGDVNADGVNDVLISQPFQSIGTDQTVLQGRAFVAFGRSDGQDVALDNIAAQISDGFEMTAPSRPGLALGQWMANAGDVNGDGYDDFLVGSLSATTYLVLGRDSFSSLDLNASGAISVVDSAAVGGMSNFRNTGSGAGDFNGDGFADFATVSFTSHGLSNEPSAQTIYGGSFGRVNIAFGGAALAPSIQTQDLAAGRGGLTIEGAFFDNGGSLSVSSAGDVNGDGLDDLIIGSPGTFNEDHAYVVFGAQNTDTILLSNVARGIGGFAVYGQPATPNAAMNLGVSVSNAGDVDGDGLNDLLIGDSFAGSSAGAANVLLSSLSYARDGNSELTQYGTRFNDVLLGTGADDRMAGGVGDDTLIGGGGTDVLYGGAGNDRISITGANQLGVVHARIDGGTGLDTLVLSSSNQAIDFTVLANSAVQNIEVIDLIQASNANITLNLSDVLNMNAAQADGRRVLTVDGGADDTVTLSSLLSGNTAGGWVSMGTTGAYTSYQLQGATGERTHLFVDINSSINVIL